MPSVLDGFSETRNAYQRDTRKPTQIDQPYLSAPTAVENSKDHYLRSAKWSFAAVTNFPRRILQEIVWSSLFHRLSRSGVALPQPESFIQRAQRLDEHGRTDAALDLIYDSTDQQLRDEQFDEMDLLLSQLCVKNLSTDVLLGLLTATLPARSRLRRRSAFFLDVKNILRDRQELEEGLLTGLE